LNIKNFFGRASSVPQVEIPEGGLEGPGQYPEAH